MTIRKCAWRFCRSLFIVASLLFPGAVSAAPAFNCLPTCSATDARFLAIAQGAGLITLTTNKLVLSVAVPAGAASFTLGVFDGDSRGADGGGLRHWDTGVNDVPYTYTLYADPLNDGSGATVVEMQAGFPFIASADMLDNAWRDFTIATGAAARAPSGVFFYRLEIQAVGSAVSLNAFKVRSDGIVTLPPLQPFSIIDNVNSAADLAIIYPSFPSLTPTTYDGTFSVHFALFEPKTELAVWDGDFDHGKFDGTESDTDDPDTPRCVPGPPAGDAECGPGMILFLPPWATPDAKPEGVAVGTAPSTGSPADDRNPAGSGIQFLRSPSVYYELRFPDGQVFVNANPSGNQEWEQFKVVVSPTPVAPALADATTTSIPKGTYEVRIIGLDINNLNALLLPQAGLCVAEDGTVCAPLHPLLVGDTVFFDTNGNGTQDPGEAGIAGVTVELLGSQGTVIGQTTTDADGHYSFAVDPGTYTVRVAASNFAPGGALVSLMSTTGGETLQRTVVRENVLTYDFGYAGPDPTIAKTHSGPFTQGQVGATYTITVTNVGGVPTDGTPVTVTDTLPVGLTATAISGPGWTCTLATLSCTRSDVLAVGASYPAITVTVNVAASATGVLLNTATVAGGGDINLANNTATDPDTIQRGPDPTIAKTHSGTFTQGQIGATYTITVTNVGGVPTDGTPVTVTDTLPVGLTATAISGPGWTCTLATLSCTRSDVLAVGVSYPLITVTVNVAVSATGTLINTAVVSGGGDVNLTNNTATDPVTITAAAPDLTIAKTHSGTFTQGQIGATYAVTVTNLGPVPTIGTVSVTDTLPAGLTATAISGPGWTCTLATLTCARSNVLAVGASYPVITVTVNVAVSATGTLINTAVVSGGGDTNPTNNTATDPVTITVAAPDLTIAKTHSGTFTQGQIGAPYTVTVTNLGPVPTNGTVSVTDTLPAGLTATAISGPGWTCTLATLSCTRSDVLAVGASYPPITVTVNVAATATGTLINTAVVSGGGDTSPANNTATDPIGITVTAAAPDLTIAKTHSGTFTQGQIGATYAVTVTNLGPVPTIGTVSVTDTLPAGLTATAISGPGWTCTLATLSCTRSDVLAVGASYPPITVTVNVAATATGTLINIATVSSGGDTNPANNTATDPVTLGAAAAIPALSPLAQALFMAIVVVTGVVFLRRRVASSQAGPGPRR